MSDNQTELVNSARSLPVPDSAPPTLAPLVDRVRLRQRKRAVIQRGALGFAAAACGACIMFVVSHGDQSDPNQAASAVANAPIASSPAANVPTMNVQDSNVVEDPVVTPPTMQLYARVRGHVPVLKFDGPARQVSVVGWVESEQTVPVDMRYVPRQQQDTFNAVLHQQATPLSL